LTPGKRLLAQQQRMMGLLITAVTMHILVTGPKAVSRFWFERGLGRAENEPGQFLIASQRYAC